MNYGMLAAIRQVNRHNAGNLREKVAQHFMREYSSLGLNFSPKQEAEILKHCMESFEDQIGAAEFKETHKLNPGWRRSPDGTAYRYK